MKKFLIKSTLVLAPVFLLIVLVNYYGDAANLFSTQYEQKIALGLLKGKQVTNVENFNERNLTKILIEKLPACPEVVVLGSSRVMLIHSEYFPGKTFFNHGVPVASIEDQVAIIRLYEKKGCLPKKIILGLDPWLLNENNGQIRWKALEQEYCELFNKLMKSNKTVENTIGYEKYSQLVSPPYFKSSFSKLFLNAFKPIETNAKVNNGLTKRSDGSISYDLKFRSATNAEVDERAVGFANGDIYCLSKFDRLSPQFKLLLEKLVAYLIFKNVEVSFFLAPYHPKSYQVIAASEKYNQVAESEKFFTTLADHYGITVLGSFNPQKLNMDSSYFYDGMHCNEKGTKGTMNHKNEGLSRP